MNRSSPTDLRVLGQEVEVVADLAGDLPALEHRSEVLGPEDGFELLPLPLPVVGDDHEAEDAEQDDDGREAESEREYRRLALHLRGEVLHLDLQVFTLKWSSFTRSKPLPI